MSEMWTYPADWGSGEVDSGRFNDEIPGNLRFLHAALPRVYQVALTGGPTSGTTELVIGTLVIPAQPIDVILIPVFQPHGNFAGSADRFVFRVRDTSTSGTVRAVADTGVPAAGGTKSGPLGRGPAFGLPANTARTLVGTVQRIGGTTGTFTASGGLEFGHLSAEVLPDLS